MFNAHRMISTFKVTNKDILLGTKDGLARTFESIDNCRFKPGYNEEVDGRLTCFKCPMRPVCNFEITDKWMNEWYVGDQRVLDKHLHKEISTDRIADIVCTIGSLFTYIVLPISIIAIIFDLFSKGAFS